MIRLAREPLLHFLLIGALLFVIFDLRQQDAVGPPNRIVVDGDEVTQLAARFERARLRPPTAEELAGLIEDRVRDEVYYREAQALGLDRDDPIVRRRMRMKLEFVLDDLSSVEADEERLRTYLEQHAERYRIEARTSLQQVFVAIDRHDDLDGAARQILQRLRQGADPDAVGDPSLLPTALRLADETLIESSFGEDFSRALASLETGDWQGPVYSPYGAHLVKIDERIDARLPSLDEVREAVERDFLAQRRDQQRDLAYRKLRDKYEIVIETPSPQTSNAGGVIPEAQAAENKE